MSKTLKSVTIIKKVITPVAEATIALPISIEEQNKPEQTPNSINSINSVSSIETDLTPKTPNIIKKTKAPKKKAKDIPLVNNKEQWTVLSFDIGVKNLAYCMMNYEKGTLKRNILYWDVVNLIPESEKHVCAGVKANGEICGNIACFEYREGEIARSYCKTHLPDDVKATPIKLKQISKVSNQELNLALVKQLNKMPFLLECDEIVLEHQPSKNPRMKNLSFMLYSYFTIRGFIDFPASKLKVIQFRQINSEKKLSLYDGPPVACALKQKYSQNKFYSEVYCEYLIKEDKKWLDFYNTHKKKDDLADCFLQGAYYLNYYLKNKKPISQK